MALNFFIKWGLSLGFFLLCLGVISFFSIRYALIQKANHVADAVIESAYARASPKNEEQLVLAIAHDIYERFEHVHPSKIFIYKLRPLITNHRLPDFIKLPDGVMETHLQKGFCDNASRMLALVLKRVEIISVQWNMMFSEGGHSARLVTLSDNREILVDPFYGVVAQDEGALLHPQKAQELVLAGAEPDDIFVAFNGRRDAGFYKNIGGMNMAAQGADLILSADIPIVANGPVFLGDVDGQEKDVRTASSNHKMMPYWHYMGHKYNREWVRVLRAHEAVRVVITLTNPVEKGVLTATPEPIVDGRTLTWTLMPGDELRFEDALAKISWRRLNSYINIDQIAFFPIL